jgi:hypothetical protein
MKNKLGFISGVAMLLVLFLSIGFSKTKKEKPIAKVEILNTKVIYSGVQNPLLISVPGIDPKDLRLTSYGGNLKADTVTPGKYFIKPASSVPVHLDVSVKSGNGYKIIASEELRVKNIEDPVFYFGNHGGDCKMSHDEIRNQLGVFSRMVNCDFSLTFRITSFSMSLYSNGVWNESTTAGPAFTDAQKKDLDALQSGDRIIFHHVNVKGFAGIDTTITRTIPGMYVVVQ